MRGHLRLKEDIHVKSNLSIIARERGKIVERRDGHNIWLALGDEWLARLIAYATFSPDVPEEDSRIKYMGFGIGGTRQQVTPVPAPVGTAYPGTNNQTDTDETITVLERPVRISGSDAVTPGLAGDQWLGTIQAPPTHPIPSQTTFTRLFGQLEISYAPYLSVPLSEIGLFLASSDPENYANTMVAYDTFDTISKTSAFELEVQWTIRF